MLRSPIFLFILCLFLFSCQEKKTVNLNTEPIREEALSLRNKAIENLKKQNFNTAFYQFNKSKKLYEVIKDSANIGYILMQIGSIQQVNGDYYGSKETLTEAFPFTKKNRLYTATIKNLIGIADKELGLYDDAIFYYKESIKDFPDLIGKSAPMSNIAAAYIFQKKYDKTITILEGILNQKILDGTQSIDKPILEDNLGYAYFKKGLDEKGFHLMSEALASRKEMNDTYGSIESYLHLADYYCKKDLVKSDEHAMVAYKIATRLNSVDERLEALQILISNDNTNQTPKYTQMYFTLNDSIIKVRNNFKNKFAKIKYDAKKEKDENEKLRLEKAENLLSLQKAKYQRIVFGIIFVFLVILITILIRYFRNKNKAIKVKTSYETETRIAKKIHDELANDVYNVIAFTESQPLTAENTKENLLQKLDDIYSRVRGISKENNSIETGADFTNNIKEMLSAYSTNQQNVLISNIESIDWEAIDDIKKITISRILQELMVNMKKHSKASLAAIKFENTANAVIINYTDNGKGSEKTSLLKSGLKNMESRVEAVNGTIDFETEPEKGFKAKIILPK